jgi:hypothetical protein
MRIRLLAAAVLVLALAGCTPAAVPPTPTPTTPASAAPLSPDLVPLSLGVVTAENAAAEGNRLVDALEALVAAESIVDVTDESALVPSADDLPAYYGVSRVYTLDPSVDVLALGQTISAVMRKSSWTMYDESNEGGVYIAALTGGAVDRPWFAVVRADASVTGQAKLILQTASPDITG